MRTVIAAADTSGFTTAIFGFAGVLVGALATILVGIVNYREARSGQVTDRLTRAVEQLESSNPLVRMGAIYALEQIAHDSKATLIARWHSVPPLADTGHMSLMSQRYWLLWSDPDLI